MIGSCATPEQCLSKMSHIEFMSSLTYVSLIQHQKSLPLSNKVKPESDTTIRS